MSYTFRKNADERLRKLVAEAIVLCQDADIPISKRVDFRYDSAECRHGQCSTYTNSDYCEISISKYLVNDDDMKNTIIHELLHTCPDGHSHGEGWQRHARTIYNAYGIVITACADKEHSKVNLASSKRRYFTKEEYEQDGGKVLVAIGVEGDSKPSWYVKRNSNVAKNISNFNCRGKKLKLFI